MKKYIIIIACIILIGIIYLFSPVNTHRDLLTQAQTDSLCEQFASQAFSERQFKSKQTQQAAVKIFGTQKKNEFITIYGYVSAGDYVKHDENAYDIAGFNEVFMIDTLIKDDKVTIVKTYGDGISTQSTLKAMPFRYRLKAKNYNAYDSKGYCKLAKEADKKAEQILGVPVETGRSISFSGNKYMIFDIDKDGNIESFEEGRLQDF